MHLPQHEVLIFPVIGDTYFMSLLEPLPLLPVGTYALMHFRIWDEPPQEYKIRPEWYAVVTQYTYPKENSFAITKRFKKWVEISNPPPKILATAMLMGYSI